MIKRTQSNQRENPTLVVEGYAAHLSVMGGRLVLHDGFANEGLSRDIQFPRGQCTVERIIVRAPAGTISIGAVDWCHRMGISLAFVGSDSRLMNCLIPDGPHDGPIKRAQAIAGMTDFGIELCRWLLKAKFASQNSSLDADILNPRVQSTLVVSPTLAQSEIQNCSSGLSSCDTLDGFLSLEGRAAQAYWRFLVGRPLPWPTWALKRIPEHWRAIGPRESGGRNRVRDARDPFNAILNYSYTLLEVETRIACAAHGLDPDFGLLHVDDRLRESFVFDLLEPLRAKVDVWALGLISKKGLRPFMFHELRDGVVRLDPDLAKLLAQSLMPKMRGPAMELASQYVAQLRKVKLPYRLQRFVGQTGQVARAPVVATYCGYCRQPLHRKGLKFCGRQCYLRHSVEIRQPIKLAQARLAEMRAQGLDPGHGGEAARKRGTKLALSNSRRSLSQTPEECRARRAEMARARRQEKTSQLT